MKISDYEQYYHQGGTYVLPIEVFNELWGEMENWEDTCKQKENIIKEVREYITSQEFFFLMNEGRLSENIDNSYFKAQKNLLEILDKEINNGNKDN